MPFNSRRWAAGLLFVLMLSACGSPNGGMTQGDAERDVLGCPDLSGRYAVVGPDPERGAKVGGATFGIPGAGHEVRGAFDAYAGLSIEKVEDGRFIWRWHYKHGLVMDRLEALREFERPRYSKWYALVSEPGRSNAMSSLSSEAYAARVAELGPEADTAVTLMRGRDFSCDEGWLLLPRNQGEALRLTLDSGGNLVGESDEITTYDVAVWCGDGCKYLGIPTGTYTGTLRFPKDPAQRAWAAEEVGRNFVFLRPAEVVEAELATFEVQRRRDAERQFATPDQVRAALTPLVPKGVVLRSVALASLPFKGARVHVVAVPADPELDQVQQDQLLTAFRRALESTSTGYLERDEVVERVISSGGRIRRELEVYLDDHPAVKPVATATWSGVADATLAQPSALMSPTTPVAFVPPPELSAPPEFDTAPARALRDRLGPMMAEGCRIEALREAGGAWRLDGSARQMECVSQTLRNLYSEGSGVHKAELLQITADTRGQYVFQLRFSAD